MSDTWITLIPENPKFVPGRQPDPDTLDDRCNVDIDVGDRRAGPERELTVAPSVDI